MIYIWLRVQSLYPCDDCRDEWTSLSLHFHPWIPNDAFHWPIDKMNLPTPKVQRNTSFTTKAPRNEIPHMISNNSDERHMSFKCLSHGDPSQSSLLFHCKMINREFECRAITTDGYSWIRPICSVWDVYQKYWLLTLHKESTCFKNSPSDSFNIKILPKYCTSTSGSSVLLPGFSWEVANYQWTDLDLGWVGMVLVCEELDIGKVFHFNH